MESSKRVHKRLYGIIAGLVLMLAVSMAGTFASSIVAIESAKDTVIGADGAFVDKKTGALVSTENPHITTKVFNQVQALEGLLSSETNAALRGHKGSRAGPVRAMHRRPLLSWPGSAHLWGIEDVLQPCRPFTFTSTVNVPADGCSWSAATAPT